MASNKIDLSKNESRREEAMLKEFNCKGVSVSLTRMSEPTQQYYTSGEFMKKDNNPSSQGTKSAQILDKAMKRSSATNPASLFALWDRKNANRPQFVFDFKKK